MAATIVSAARVAVISAGVSHPSTHVASTLFSTLWKDLVVAAILGAVGGVGYGLLQEKGLQFPRRYSSDSTPKTTFLDLGFVASVLIGMLGAVITYAINTPNSKAQLVGTAIIAGIGGTGILKGYVNGQAARSEADHADQLKAVAREAVSKAGSPDLTTLLDQIDATHEKRRARYGIV